MNSNYGKANTSSSKSSSFDFDLGLDSSSKSKPLNAHKNPNANTNTASSYTSSSYYSNYNNTQSKPTSTWQPNKPSWTHQPATPPTTTASLNGPTSMVGDISGKSWNSTLPYSGGAGGSTAIGLVDKNPNLFGDLFSSALGQGVNRSTTTNVPLKNAAATPLAKATPGQSAYSMGNLADSLPKTNTWGASKSGFNGLGTNANANNKSANVGASSMKSMPTGGVRGGMNTNRDPFGSLLDFSAKQPVGSMNSATKPTSKANSGADDLFGDFQNAPKPNTASFPSGGGFSSTSDDFTDFISSSNSKSDNFASQKQPPVQNNAGDPMDMFFSSSASSAGGPQASGGGQQFSEDDWGMDSEAGGGGSTTELEGLPPPPAGVTGSSAKNKGIDNQKSGQYPDAIKWLSWAVVLFEKVGDKTSTTEVLTSRASCYKEVGEYKKAVADCSKVLETDKANTSVLVQRALLYESMEKYKLGAEDLRTVLKIDPGNRIARSTIHRLTKMID
ncbi:hypothetical protein ACFE04_006314 [Oxalis oulophora]